MLYNIGIVFAFLGLFACAAVYFAMCSRLMVIAQELRDSRNVIRQLQDRLSNAPEFFIAAETRDHAEFVARQLRFAPPARWTYLSEQDMLMGMIRPVVIIYDTAHRHPKWDQIQAELKLRRASVLFFHEPRPARVIASDA